MRNCVGGYWLSNYGNNPYKAFARGIVFVREDSNPQRSFIDCDFVLKTMKINQFFMKNNESFYRKEMPEALALFKEELQAHLLTFKK